MIASVESISKHIAESRAEQTRRAHNGGNYPLEAIEYREALAVAVQELGNQRARFQLERFKRGVSTMNKTLSKISKLLNS